MIAENKGVMYSVSVKSINRLKFLAQLSLGPDVARFLGSVHPLWCQSWSLTLLVQEVKNQNSWNFIVKSLLLLAVNQHVHIARFHENLHSLFVDVMADFVFEHALVKIKSLHCPFVPGVVLLKDFLSRGFRLVLLLNVRQNLIDYVGHDISVLILLIFLHFFVMGIARCVFLIFSIQLLNFLLVFRFCFTGTFFIDFFFQLCRGSNQNGGKERFGLCLLQNVDFFSRIKRWVVKEPIEVNLGKRTGWLKRKLNY